MDTATRVQNLIKADAIDFAQMRLKKVWSPQLCVNIRVDCAL